MGGGFPNASSRACSSCWARRITPTTWSRFRAALLDVLPAAYTSYNEVGADGTPLVARVTPDPGQRYLGAWRR
jgi:hypothetical protein